MSFAQRRIPGHSLLEAIMAAGVFVMVAVALSGIWVMYGRALAKSAENLAANHLARSVTEGLIANGYDWLKSNVAGVTPLLEENYTMKRQIRSRSADIKYNVTYEAVFNTGVDPTTRPLAPFLSADTCRLIVSVRWNSNAGDIVTKDTKYNNEITYTSYVYKNALN